MSKEDDRIRMRSLEAWRLGLLVVPWAFLLGMLAILQEGPPSSAMLGKTSYNLVDVSAPAAAGPLLPWVAWVVARSPVSPWILRYLLNANGAAVVRGFAVEHCAGIPPAWYPIHKATASELELGASWNQPNRSGEDHQGVAITTTDAVLARGLEGLGHPEQTSAYRSVQDYHGVYRSGKATPSDVMERWWEGSEQLAGLKIFASAAHREDLLAQALASDARWNAGKPLSVWDGVPVAIKDQSAVQGHPLCFGSSECSLPQAEDDLPAARLRAAGAILVGTTVMPEGGVTPLGYAPFFGGPFNPYSKGHYSGGSSAGSAVAVASGLVPMAVGWDGGGSIRVPAAMSGCVGLAVTWGRIPYKTRPFSSVTKAGPLAATIADAALAYLVLAGSEPGHFYNGQIGEDQIPLPHLDGIVDRSSRVDREDRRPLKGVRLGIFWDHFRHTDPEIVTRSEEAVRFLEQQGAELVNVTIPHLREIHLSHSFRILAEFGVTWESEFYNASYALEANTEITLALGRSLSAGELLAVEKIRTFAIGLLRDKVFRGDNLDAIVSPMLGGRVPSTPRGYEGYGESNTPLVYKIMRYVPLANFLGLPAVSVPIGYEADTGLPIGFQVMGDAWSEAKILRIAGVLEGFSSRKPPPSPNHFDVLEPWLGVGTSSG